MRPPWTQDTGAWVQMGQVLSPLLLSSHREWDVQVQGMIPVTQEAEAGESQVGGQPQQPT